MRRKKIEVLKKWEKEAKSVQIKPSPTQPHEFGLGKPESKQMKMCSV